MKDRWFIRIWKWITDKFIWTENLYDLFRYNIPYFIKNLWNFKKILWNHRDWDFVYTLILMQQSIKHLKNNVNNGYEVDISKNKKVVQIDRVLELLENHIQDTFIEQAEKIHGKLIHHPFKFNDIGNDLVEIIYQDTETEMEHNSKIYDYSHKLEKEQWDELWDIIKGNNPNPYDNNYITIDVDELIEEEEEKYNEWDNGSDARGWWS